MNNRPMLAAMTLALGLMIAAPHMARAQEREASAVVERDSHHRGPPQPPTLAERSPAGEGERFEDLGGDVYALGGGIDAGVDAGIDGGTGPPDAGDDPDADPGPDAALPAPADRGGCSVGGGPPPVHGAACAMLFLAGLLWRRR